MIDCAKLQLLLTDTRAKQHSVALALGKLKKIPRIDLAAARELNERKKELYRILWRVKTYVAEEYRGDEDHTGNPARWLYELKPNCSAEELNLCANNPRIITDVTRLVPERKNELKRWAGGLVDSSKAVSFRSLREVGGDFECAEAEMIDIPRIRLIKGRFDCMNVRDLAAAELEQSVGGILANYARSVFLPVLNSTKRMYIEAAREVCAPKLTEIEFGKVGSKLEESLFMIPVDTKSKFTRWVA